MTIKSTGKIIYNKSIRPHPSCRDYLMRLKVKPFPGRVIPGQFIHLRLAQSPNHPITQLPILRRPFSIYNIPNPGSYGTRLEILYRVVGKGTRLMASMTPGTKVDILGPLGNGFTINKKVDISILVAGGIGMAGLHLLLKTLIQSRPGRSPKKIYLLIGTKNKDELCLPDTLRRREVKMMISTEDGSRGVKGLVTDLLEELLIRQETRDKRQVPIQIYACGPKGMLKAVSTIARTWNLPCQVSLEARMACGLGFCRTCVCRVYEKNTISYARVCSEGPVFRANQIAW